MAQPTAQFEALQYSSRRRDQDFGGFAMELAQQEKERQALEYKRKREEEQFQMDMINDNPDVVYASFENSGLENIDAYNAKVSELVKGRFNELNAQYNKDGDRMKYFTAVAKLKGEVRGYTTGVNNIIKYGQDLVAKGDEVSASTLYRSQQLDKMFKGGAPTMSADGSIGNVSMSVDEDGKPISEAFNWGKASSLIGVKGRSDMHAVAAESVKTFGDPSKFIVPEGKTVLSTLLERDGSMNQAGLRLIEENTRALSDEDLIDTADQMGITVNFDRKDITKFDRERIVKEVARQESAYAIDLLKMKEKTDDVQFKEIDLKDKTYNLRLRQLREQQKQAGEALPFRAAFITDEMDTSGEGKRIEYYMKEDVTIESANLKEELKANTILGQRAIDVQGDVNILSYKENDRFGDQVKVQYTVLEVPEIEMVIGGKKQMIKDPNAKPVKKVIEEFIPLESRALELNNRIRTRIGLNPRSVDAKTYYSTGTVPQGTTPKRNKKKSAY